jgi:S-adenosylmethionine/arginine decarboxylase-like enzyme
LADDTWGWLTAVDTSGCDEDAINDERIFRAFIDEMLIRLDMVPIGDPIIVFCETHDPLKRGWTFYQILQDSNISVHLCSATRCGFFDIFSCKPYDQNVVVEVVRKFFRPTTIRTQFIDRFAP